jgi:tRNA G18 (ribose-2'-O)-methylase SpoU
LPGYHHPVPVIPVQDATDLQIAGYRNLPDPEIARAHGLFVAEGRLVVRRLLESTFVTRSVMVTAAALSAVEDLTSGRPDLPVFIVPPDVMSTVAGFDVHRGCLALGERPAPRPWAPLACASRRLVALEAVGNADNVGSVFRCAAAFGADGVLMGPSCADPLYRKAIRTSMGAALQLPSASAAPWPGALAALREDGWMVVGLTPAASAEPLSQLPLAAPGLRTALVLGHEGDGLTPAAMDACSHLARIPMATGTDSLNVAVAAGIALYELARATHTAAP